MSGALDALQNVTVDKYRFTKVSAEKFTSANNITGYIHTSVNFSVAAPTDADVKNSISTVHLTVIGMPGEKPEKGKEPKGASPHFRIEVNVDGFVSWQEAPTQAVISDDASAPYLCRSTYLVAALEVKALAMKLGISQLALNMDLAKNIVEADDLQKNMPSKPRSVKSSAAKKTTEKP